jgi:hypothetical protein
MRAACFTSLALITLAIVGISAGHHSPSLYDQSADVTLTGIVKRVEWENPHVCIHLRVEDRGGRSVEWVVEAQSPRVMTLFGWNPKKSATPCGPARHDSLVQGTNPPRVREA